MERKLTPLRPEAPETIDRPDKIASELDDLVRAHQGSLSLLLMDVVASEDGVIGVDRAGENNHPVSVRLALLDPLSCAFEVVVAGLVQRFLADHDVVENGSQLLSNRRVYACLESHMLGGVRAPVALGAHMNKELEIVFGLVEAWLEITVPLDCRVEALLVGDH